MWFQVHRPLFSKGRHFKVKCYEDNMGHCHFKYLTMRHKHRDMGWCESCSIYALACCRCWNSEIRLSITGLKCLIKPWQHNQEKTINKTIRWMVVDRNLVIFIH